jgi:uncharacterized protein (TIGR03118 family)
MKKSFISRFHYLWIISGLVFINTGCQKNIETPNDKITTEATTADKLLARQSHGLKDFVQVNLVGDNNDLHPVRVDPNLINAWGMAFAPSGPDWISANGTGLSVIYNTAGNDVRPPVTIPSATSATGGHPTGVVFNSSTSFKLPNGNPARFIFVGDDGIISGWNSGNAAIKVLDRSASSVYTGLAWAADGLDTFIYAANFKTAKIDVFDRNWNQVFTKPFRDFHLPHGYAPFNIQNVSGKLFVMYAKVAADGDEEAGPGNGFADIYRPNGSLIRRFVSRDKLNAPWGVAMAPDNFIDTDHHDGDHHDGDHHDGDHHDGDHHDGDHDKSLNNGKDGHHDDGNDDLKNVILIGNFGDGRINAYNEEGHFIGHLRSHGEPIEIEGLWAISFAPATATTIDPKWLFFAAGPGDEKHGLFGYIKK